MTAIAEGPARPAEPALRATPVRTRAGSARALLSTARPGQWVKNGLLFAAPAAAGALDHLPTLLQAGAGFGAFTLAAAGTYLLNDVRDVEADRRHPTKRDRPIAAGTLGVPTAMRAAAVAFVLALVVAAWLGWAFAAVLAMYLILTTAYSLRLKHVPVLDIVAVSTGFLLRAVAGGVATGVALSDWFLLVALFGALFVVVGKRYSEQRAVGSAGATRAALAGYPADFLGQLTTVAMAGTLLGYAAWAFQYLGAEVFHPLLALSLLPFTVVILRYGLIIAGGEAESPERVAAHDRFLQVAAVVWLLLVVAGLYLA